MKDNKNLNYLSGADYGSPLELTDLNYSLFFPDLVEAQLLTTQLQRLNDHLLISGY